MSGDVRRECAVKGCNLGAPHTGVLERGGVTLHIPLCPVHAFRVYRAVQGSSSAPTVEHRGAGPGRGTHTVG